MKIETIITPKVNFAEQSIELERRDLYETSSGTMVCYQHATHTLLLRDKATRDALICLGWRPPAEPGAQHSSTPVDNDTRLRVRAHDPSTSVSAAEKAALFAGGHKARILSVCSQTRPMTAAEISSRTGLTVEQVARRTSELQRDGRLVLAQLGDEEMVVDGFRCWLLAPTKS